MSIYARTVILLLLWILPARVHAIVDTIATWGDNSTHYPYYSAWNGTTWSAPAVISSNTSFTAFVDVYTSYNSSLQETIATWADHSTKYPYYSVYNGTSWSTPAVISSNTSFVAGNNVCTSYNTNAGITVATWADNSSFKPYYSVYNGTTWRAPAIISFLQVYFDVYTSYNPDTAQTIAVWSDRSTYQPYFSVYNGSSWSSPVLINSNSSFRVVNQIYTSYNSSTNQTIATWSDSSSLHPFFSTYDGSSWSTPAAISSNLTADVYTSFDSNTGQTVATWTDIATHFPYYAIYDGLSWSTPAVISTNTSFTALTDTYVSYNIDTDQIIATWANVVPTYPYFSVYNGTWSTPAVISSNTSFTASNVVFSSSPPVGSVIPPLDFAGSQQVNNFGIVSERFNTLTWQASLPVENYDLYRNGTLIAVLDGSADSYEDHDQPKNPQTYDLIANYIDGSSGSSTIMVGG